MHAKNTHAATSPPTTTARQRHDACHPTLEQRTSTTHATHIAHSHVAYEHTSRTAATTAHRATITARTPPRARHTQNDTQLRPPHTPPTEKRTQSHTPPPRHTHTRAVRLVSVDGMLPESWLVYNCNELQDTRNSHRVTPWHPTPPPTPASRPRRSAAQRSAAHSINQFKSNETPVSTLHAIDHAQHRVRVTPATTQAKSRTGT
jgi:hypothetical protein